MKLLSRRLLWGLLAATVAAATAKTEPAPAQPAAATDTRDEARERDETRERDPTRQGKGTPARADQGGNEDKQDKQGKEDKDDTEDANDEKNEASGKLALTASQQEAVGIRIEAPRPLASAPGIDAYGTVLDPLALLTDAQRIETTRANAAAASADAARQESLYRDGAQASLKALQTSQAQSIEANAQTQAAVLGFRQQWGPLADWSAARRHALLSALTSGQRLLLRADVPGRHLSGAIARDAIVEVDGAHVAAQVLGALPRTDAQSQSAGWLLEIERAPQGLGPGARAAVRLQVSAVRGMLVPATALIYAEQGAYVYRRIQGDKADTFRYESVAVRPLTRLGDAWLVDGLARADQIVVQGAGVLWSLQGINSFSAAEEEHD
jgi:hypothetical protein